jgi:superfamily II RNA helicase
LGFPLSLDLNKLFPFPLDGFQQEAIESLDAGRSVVVCAPTGSGKTLIGEYAIHRALAQGKRVLYTTPLKALSNQKLRDFRDNFGADQVGLLTGDISINRDAAILVMTTEIFRNMLYGTPIGEVGTSMEGVETVVLDECHYMNDRDRGTVWEESIIYAPPTVQLVALSATIANSDQLTEWISEVHGPTDLIYSDYRPVPLQFGFCTAQGLFPLLDPNGQDLHPTFKAQLKKQKGKPSRKQPESPSIGFVLSHLRQRDMLPAIYFIFSRRGCDGAVADCGELNLVNPAEAESLRAQIEEFTRHNPDAVRQNQVAALHRGIAAHHAGVLPAWKGLVEELFQQGLVKVVFATETLAAGINMPARTTVISALSKRTDDGHRLLFPSEFLQMAGRAGRRGMDDRGYVVTVQSRFQGVKEAAYLATAKADPLVSQFTPSYGMVLNLLQIHTLEEAQALVERSFGRYLALLTLKPQQEAIVALEREHRELKAQLEAIDWSLFDQYEKLKGRLKEEKRLLKILQDQAEERIASGLAIALSFAVAGTLLSLKGKNVPVATPLPAVLVNKFASGGEFPYLVCLGADNYWYVVTTADVVGLHGELCRLAEVDYLPLLPGLEARAGQRRMGQPETIALSERVGSLLARHSASLSITDMAEEVRTQAARMMAIQVQVENHPVHQWDNRGRLLKRQNRLEQLEAELDDRRSKLQRYTHRHWEEFLSLMEVLQEFECLEGLRPNRLGETVSALRGDNELWLGLALSSGALDDLAPHHLAAACQALVTEVSRPEMWVHYPIPGAVTEALDDLRIIRRRLFQVQHRQQIALPVWYELDYTGISEQWALGVDWADLCSQTSLDEGDLVRILRRTLDFLHQIPHAPHLPEELKRNAHRAIHLIDRFPIREVVVFEELKPGLDLEELELDELEKNLDVQENEGKTEESEETNLVH